MESVKVKPGYYSPYARNCVTGSAYSAAMDRVYAHDWLGSDYEALRGALIEVVGRW